MKTFHELNTYNKNIVETRNIKNILINRSLFEHYNFINCPEYFIVFN